MPGLGAALFQLGLAEQALPTDKTYILPGFEVKPTITETEMGVGALMASHIFKPKYRDDPFLKPTPRPKKFEPITPSARQLNRTVSMPEDMTTTAQARRQVFKRRRVNTCQANFHYGSEDNSIAEEPEVDVKDVKDEVFEPKAEDRLRAADSPALPEVDIPSKPRLSKKQRRALKVAHAFGWVLCCPLYTMVSCVREAPDPDDVDDLEEDTCLPCYT